MALSSVTTSSCYRPKTTWCPFTSVTPSITISAPKRYHTTIPINLDDPLEGLEHWEEPEHPRVDLAKSIFPQQKGEESNMARIEKTAGVSFEGASRKACVDFLKKRTEERAEKHIEEGIKRQQEYWNRMSDELHTKFDAGRRMRLKKSQERAY